MAELLKLDPKMMKGRNPMVCGLSIFLLRHRHIGQSGLSISLAATGNKADTRWQYRALASRGPMIVKAQSAASN